ncbi:MAG: IS1595 family transposase [Chloroflexi bacterium]|nr:IS1595 family transposase [Chloroflexota bacterium]
MARPCETFIASNIRCRGERRAGVRCLGGRALRKTAVFGTVERGGDIRTMAVEQSDEKAKELKHITLSNLELSKTHLMTDVHSATRTIKGVVRHDVINHEIAYVEGNVHTQNIESFWSLLKRGMFGTFHHVSRHRLPMYLSEFEYRFNQRKVSDGERFDALISRTCGRLRWNFRRH